MSSILSAIRSVMGLFYHFFRGNLGVFQQTVNQKILKKIAHNLFFFRLLQKNRWSQNQRFFLIALFF